MKWYTKFPYTEWFSHKHIASEAVKKMEINSFWGNVQPIIKSHSYQDSYGTTFQFVFLRERSNFKANIYTISTHNSKKTLFSKNFYNSYPSSVVYSQYVLHIIWIYFWSLRWKKNYSWEKNDEIKFLFLCSVRGKIITLASLWLGSLKSTTFLFCQGILPTL